jgi:hypothetical protein
LIHTLGGSFQRMVRSSKHGPLSRASRRLFRSL